MPLAGVTEQTDHISQQQLEKLGPYAHVAANESSWNNKRGWRETRKWRLGTVRCPCNVFDV